MFLDPYGLHKKRCGSIEIICGSMFSGKTQELIRRIKRAKLAKLNVQVYKPRIDTRYNSQKIVSHNTQSIDANTIEDSNEILDLIEDQTNVVGIDECQFFKDNVAATCNKLANKGIRVIISGLDMDFLGNPFGNMPHLLAVSDHITKLHAICTDCGNLANHSYRISAEKDIIHLGEKDNYKALCRKCFKTYQS
tara:strand:+ start:50 stop:628 length:579 start_codon:yes stop_codon:yes gene_type:complete